MPETIEITVYKYDELTGRAKDKAREALCERATSHEWWDDVYDLATEDGAERGFDIEDIRFSGFWSQGDGASWTGDVHWPTLLEWMLNRGEDSPQHRRIGDDRHRYLCLIELAKDGWIEQRVNILRNLYHYVHENTVKPESDVDWGALYNEMGLDTDVQYANPEPTLHSEGVLKGASVIGVAEGIDVKNLMPELDEIIKDEVRDFCKEIYRMLEAEYDSLISDENIADFAEANDYRFDEYGGVV